MNKSHRNNKSRTTAPDRAAEFLGRWFASYDKGPDEPINRRRLRALSKMLGLHVEAAQARARRAR